MLAVAVADEGWEEALASQAGRFDEREESTRERS